MQNQLCRIIFCLVLALGLCQLWCITECCAQNKARQKPNVLMISIDDLNDWVGCMGGHPQARTPNIDRLARSGVLFANAHCQGPICGPSRCSLFSGRYPSTTGVYLQPSGKLLEKDSTFFKGQLLPEYFASCGYDTTAVGKVTHGYRAQVAFQNFGGAFEKFGPKPPNKKRFHYHLPNVRFSGTQTDWGAYPERDEQMPDSKSAEFAEKFLAVEHEAPFFLAVGFVRPHVPFYVPSKWFNDFPLESVELPKVLSNDLEDVPQIARDLHEMPKYPDLKFLQANDHAQFRLCVQAYLACTSFVDHQVGRVLDALAASKHAKNTVIVLFSDHGYHLGEKGRVSKHSLWEEATRVPLVFVPSVANGQSDFKPGTVSSKPVGLIDVFPTLADLCGLPRKSTNEGVSLKPLIGNPDADWKFATLTTYAKNCHSLRSQRYRYIRYDNGPEELYDHKVDPNEWNNLANREGNAELIARFRALLPKTNANYHPAVKLSPVNAWFEKHLKANGVE